MSIQRSERQPHTYVRPALWNGRLALGNFVLAFSLNRREEPPPTSLANHLETLRKERGLSRQEVAHHLFIHPSTLSALEKGSYQPSLSLALRLSRFFEQPIEDMFFSAAQHLS